LASSFQRIDELVAKAAPRLQDTRKHFHKYPELSWQERETSTEIRRQLARMGMSFREGLARGYGVTVDIQGSKPGPVIAYRADIDALPIQEQNIVPYRSMKAGVMHACGHDAHITVGLGLVEVLKELKDHFAGTIRVMFQPAEEENPSGAPAMIQDGVLENVDAAWAIHVDPTLEPETFGVKAGVLTAAVDSFHVRIKGKACHSARPHLGIDPIPLMARIIQGIHEIKSTSVDPWLPGIINIGMAKAGEASNIIASVAELRGTMRTFDNVVRETLKNKLMKLVPGICEGADAQGDVKIDTGAPSVVNHTSMVDVMRTAVTDAYGTKGLKMLERPSTGGDDFAWYGQTIPMFMARVGTKVGEGHGLHTPLLEIADPTVPAAVRVMARAMIAHLAAMRVA